MAAAATVGANPEPPAHNGNVTAKLIEKMASASKTCLLECSRIALVECEDCGGPLCGECDIEMHSTGDDRLHTRIPLLIPCGNHCGKNGTVQAIVTTI